MKKIGLTTLILSSILAANDYKYEITPLVGYQVKPERYVEIGDHEVFGFSVSRNLDNSPINKLKVGLLQSASLKYVNSTMDTKITQIFLNGLKDYKMNDKFKLYALAGLGYERISNEQFNNESSSFVSYGVGVAYAFANDLSLKVDAKHQLKFGGDSSIVYTVGVSIPLAKKEEPLIIAKKEKPLTVIAPSELVMFLGFNDDKIKYKNMPKFEEYVSYLNKVTTATIIIESNADSIGSYEYNLDLSQRRGDNAKNQLISMGISPNRIKVIAYGERKKIASNMLEAGRALNRRVTVRIENK